MIVAPQDELLALAAPLTGSTGWMADAVAVALPGRDDGTVGAVAVFQAFAGWNAEIHIGTTPGNPLTRAGVQTFLEAAFGPTGFSLRTLWAPIPEANIPAMIAALKLGFTFEARRRGYAGDGGDVILLALHRPETEPDATAMAAGAIPQGGA